MAATQLSNAQLAGIRNVFQSFDTNGDGTVSSGEIGRVLRKLGRNLNEDELNQKVALMDKNGSGRIEFEEFIDVAAEILLSPWTDSEIERAFEIFDVDGSGKISADELKQVAMASGIRATDDELDIMLKSADLDGDGQVKYSEFYRIMKN